MNKIILDTNILFSAILKKESKIGQLILLGGEHIDYYAPEYAIQELIRHKEKLTELGRMSEADFDKILDYFTNEITVFNHEIIPPVLVEEAIEICRPIDLNDSIFVASALFIDARLWTGDKKSSIGLDKAGLSITVSTSELFQELNF